MSLLFTIILLASMVAAQANHIIHGFEYFGCVNITSDQFGTVVNFPSAYTPEQCQSACTGFNYAAAFAAGCRCGNVIESLPRVDEASCSNPCNGDVELGFCGFSRSATGCSYANVYQACEELPSAPAQLPSEPSVPAPVTTPADPSVTFSVIRLPTITRTLRLASKSTIVVHTVTQENPTTPCPTDPVVVVQTVIVNIPPKSTPGLQSYGSLPSDPPVVNLPPTETGASPPQSPFSSIVSLTSLVPAVDPPIPAATAPSNGTTIISSTSEGPEFRTILPDDPPASGTTVVPAVVTTAGAHRANVSSIVAVVVAFLMALAVGM